MSTYGRTDGQTISIYTCRQRDKQASCIHTCRQTDFCKLTDGQTFSVYISLLTDTSQHVDGWIKGGTDKVSQAGRMKGYPIF